MNRESDRIYDEFLVAAAITGDQAALSRLVVRWQPRLLRHAWRLLGDAERAKDMVQEAWVEILRGLARLDDVAAFPAWAYRIATRRCQREFRRKDRQAFDTEFMDAETGMEVPENASGEFAVDVSIVIAAIATLPGPQRAALALFYIDELSVAEIAIATDVPPGTVKTPTVLGRDGVVRLGRLINGGGEGAV